MLFEVFIEFPVHSLWRHLKIVAEFVGVWLSAVPCFNRGAPTRNDAHEWTASIAALAGNPAEPIVTFRECLIRAAKRARKRSRTRRYSLNLSNY